MQFSSCFTYIGNHPILFVTVRYSNTGTGQTLMQKLHALHMSSPMTTSHLPAVPALGAFFSSLNSAMATILQRADGAEHISRLGPGLDVVRERRPPHDACAVDHDGGGTRDVLAALPAPLVEQPEPPGDLQIGVGQEPVVDVEAPRQLLATLVRIGTDREDLGPGRFELVRDGSKTLELACAERSPVAAIEDENDRLAIAIVGEAGRLARRIRQRKIRRRLSHDERGRPAGNPHQDEVEGATQSQQEE